MSLQVLTKTCIYHNIPGYFGISQVVFKFKTSNQVKQGDLVLNMHIPVWSKICRDNPNCDLSLGMMLVSL